MALFLYVYGAGKGLMKQTLVFMATIGVLFAVAGPTQGATIILSDLASDGATPPSPTVLDATFDFTLSSNLLEDDPILTFSVHNQTTVPDEFDINELYFNAPDNVTGMSVISGGTGWTLDLDNAPGGGFNVNGFGMYDVAMVDGVGGDPHEIIPGEIHVFEIQLSGAGPIADIGFVSEFTEIDPGFGGTPTLVAAKFVSGPGDASAYGATIPEPGSLAMLVLGGLMLLRRRR